MDRKTNIGIHLCNRLMSEAIYQLLVHNGYEHVAISENSEGFTPHVLIVDSATLTRDLLARYPEAKVLLVDTGVEMDRLGANLFSSRIHGILSPRAELRVLKKALKAVSGGQMWIDNTSVKAALEDDARIISKLGKGNAVTAREQEIIEYVCKGLTNKEIAQKLGLSAHTVKAHLNHIFTKFNVTSRSKLIALALDRPHARSA